MLSVVRKALALRLLALPAPRPTISQSHLPRSLVRFRRGGRKEGHGIYTWPDGATYEGKYKKGRRHGSGLQTMSDGAV